MSDAMLTNRLGALALILNDLLEDAVERAAGHGGETAAALCTLGENPGMGPGDLAAAVGLSQPGGARLVDRLEADGLVLRGEGRDRRSVALRLSAWGDARRRAILDARKTALAGALTGLDPAARQRLLPLVDAMLKALSGSGQRALQICRLCDEGACDLATCPVEERPCGR